MCVCQGPKDRQSGVFTRTASSDGPAHFPTANHLRVLVLLLQGGKLGTMIEYRNVGPLRNQETKGIGDRKKNESEASRFCWPRSAAERRQKSSFVTSFKNTHLT